MDEELIEVGTDETFEVAQAEIIENDVDITDIQQSIDTEEEMQLVEVSDVEEIIIEMDESIGWVGGDSTRHHSLNGRDEDNQHPINAITGLRSELDELQRLKTVYSDRMNVANYYKWANAAYDTYGYFVSIASNTSTIAICQGSEIFGVSVSDAGFIGGQDANVPRDGSYGLVVTSGLVDVRCELDVEVGDYVISNAQGYAKKSVSNYGYKVVAKEIKDGTEYAVILLGIQADITDMLGQNLIALQRVVDAHDKNIISVVNVANQAYNKSVEASEASSVSVEAVKKALESVLEMETDIEEFEKVLTDTSNTAAQARAIADSAVIHAETLKTEAISRANDAWAKADKVETEAYSLCAKIDKYSVGEYSQAHGLTFEQTQGILEPGVIYVPTRHIGSDHHTETYGEYERIFTPEYLYQWGYISDIQGYGWITIDKDFHPTNYNSEVEVNSAHKSVYFSFKEPYVAVGEDFGYWYTDGAEIEDQEGKVGTYEPYTLYKWEYDHWLVVATLQGNVSNRAVSEIYQTTNQISLTLSNARGDFASIDERLTDTESKVTTTTQWTKGSDEQGNALLYNLATIEQKSDDGGSSIVLAVADMEGNKVINGAEIVLGQEDGGSYFYLDADKIDFHGGEMKFDANNIDFTAGDFTVGGRNLLTGTTSPITIKPLDNKSNFYTFTPTISPLEMGNIYTFSADVEILQGTPTEVSVVLYNKQLTRSDHAVKLPINNGHIVGTLSPHTDTADVLLLYAGVAGATNNNSLKFSNIKLECGGVPTDWTPAPEDQVLTQQDSTQMNWRMLPDKCVWWNNVDGTNSESTPLMRLDTSGLYIKGEIEATSGKIGNWDIGTNHLTNGTIGQDNSFHMYTSFPSEAATVAGVSSNAWRLTIGSNFGVDSSGTLYATNAIVKGNITATSGYIGNDSDGFTIESKYIANNKTSYNDSTNDGVYLGTDGIGLGKGKFYVDDTGYLYSTNGKVGGWDIGASHLTNGTIGQDNSFHMYTLFPDNSPVSIGGSEGKSNWRLTIGSDLGVDSGGSLYANNAHILGEFTASSLLLTGDGLKCAGTSTSYDDIIEISPTYGFTIISSNSPATIDYQLRLKSQSLEFGVETNVASNTFNSYQVLGFSGESLSFGFNKMTLGWADSTNTFIGTWNINTLTTLKVNNKIPITGWVKYLKAPTDARYMHFIKGILVEETNTQPASIIN